MAEITIRKATLQDCEDIAKINLESLGYDCDASYVRSKFAKMDINNNCVFVAEYDGKVIGCIQVQKYEPLDMDTVGNILGLAVLSQYYRMGAGRMLMGKAEEWTKSVGGVGMRINSGISRIGAHEFYRKMGYNIGEKEQKRFLKMF